MQLNDRMTDHIAHELGWLEPPHSPEALAWARARTQATCAWLKGFGGFDDLYQALSRILWVVSQRMV